MVSSHRYFHLLTLFLVAATLGDGFVVPQGSVARHRNLVRELNAIDAEVVGEARAAFVLWFFGGSGGVGIALSAFPRMFSRFQQVRALGTVGPSSGGDTVGLSPLCLYPADVAVADVEQICNTNLSVEQIVDQYPVEGNFLSSSGYLTFAAFEQANANANPLALRVVFDTFNAGSDVASPMDAQDALDVLKMDPKTVASKAFASKLRGYAAITALVFLMTLAVYQSLFVYFREGWFPEWPGLENLPGSLFDAETGLTAIPRYWLSDEV